MNNPDEARVAVSREAVALAEDVVSAANIVSHDGYYEIDIDKVAAVLASRLATRDGAVERLLPGWKIGGTDSANDEDRPGAWVTSPDGETISQYSIRQATYEMGRFHELQSVKWRLNLFSMLLGALARQAALLAEPAEGEGK